MSEQHILMIGGSAETEAVLRTVLRPRSVGVERARPGHVSESTRPTVVLIQNGANDSSWPDVPRVVVGEVMLPGGRASSLFEYPDLVAAIDRVLRDSV